MFMRVKHFTTKNQHIHTYKCVSGSCQSGAQKKFINHPEASTKKSSARHKKFTHEHFKNFFFYICQAKCLSTPLQKVWQRWACASATILFVHYTLCIEFLHVCNCQRSHLRMCVRACVCNELYV